MFRLDEAVLDWRRELSRHHGLKDEDAEELESHLWDIIDSHLYTGVPLEEAFLRARERMGESRSLAAEFAALYKEEDMDFEERIEKLRDDPSELEKLYHQKPQTFTSCLSRVLERFPESAVLRTWKARLSYAPFLADRRKELVELLTLIGLCLAAAIAVKLPLAWGIDVWTVDFGPNAVYPLNVSFFFMPMIAAYYLLKEKPSVALVAIVAAIFAAAFAGINLMPAREPWQTRILSILHLPFLLWLVVGVAFSGNQWRRMPVRMDFLRFTGELFIYTVLILLGGMVLTGFTLAIFNLIGMDIRAFYIPWVAVIGLSVAPIVATWLTEKKRELADNFAPILSYIFTPLFLVTLVVFLGAMIGLRKSPWTDRDFLLMFNAMLVLVIALVLYNISERKLTGIARVLDALNGVLIVVALAIDGIALSAIIMRLSSYGASPNRIALLGENIVLLFNLAGLAVQYSRFYAGRTPFSAVENWTVRCLPVYFGWLAVVVFLFPVVFSWV